MCAIVDANVASEVFGPNPTPAGAEFFHWIERGSVQLVIGGELLRELEKASPRFREWASAAILAGAARRLNDDEVDARSNHIRQSNRHSKMLRSNDPHVLAVAQLSGARLLFTNDDDLQRDFKTKEHIDNPRGRIYHTRRSKEVTATHKRLLCDRTLCQRG